MSKTYAQGKADALELYGRVCSRQSSCLDCEIGILRGENMSCQEFMKKFPNKMLSLLTEMDNKEYTYYDEYITRFPACGLVVDDLSAIVCRRCVFEGYVECENTDCKECWLKPYTGDITE